MKTGPTDARALDERPSRRLDAEPSLQELLDDPVMEAIMTRDGVERAALIELMAEVRGRLHQRECYRHRRELCPAELGGE